MFGLGMGGFFGGFGGNFGRQPGLGFNLLEKSPLIEPKTAPVVAPAAPARPIATNTINQQAASRMGFSGDSPEMRSAVNADQQGQGLLPVFRSGTATDKDGNTPLPRSRPSAADAIDTSMPLAGSAPAGQGAPRSDYAADADARAQATKPLAMNYDDSGSVMLSARSKTPQAGSGDIGSYLTGLTKQYNLPPGYLTGTAKIESSFNPNEVSSTGAAGLFQFTKGTAKRYGLSNRFDPYQSADAAARLALDNKSILSKRLGRDPTAGELYLAHQQGASGASALLSNPDANVVDALAPAYGGNRAAARRAVTVNGGKATMTAGDFAARWTGRFDGSGRSMVASAQPVQLRTAAAGVPTVPSVPSVPAARPMMVASAAPPGLPTQFGGTPQVAPGLGMPARQALPGGYAVPGVAPQQGGVPPLEQTPAQAPNIVDDDEAVKLANNPLPMNWQA